MSADAARCTVLIGPDDRLASLREKVAAASVEVLAFADTEALKALDAIIRRKPEVVSVERLFAASPRGAALINRIKADPKLDGAEIRVVAHDSDYSRVSPRRRAPAPAPALDQRGTRRAPRHKMAAAVLVQVDAGRATLVDLSAVGAQVLSAAKLAPDQRVAMTLADGQATVTFRAKVVWTSFEIPPGDGPRYRSGIDFEGADGPAVDAFGIRHRA
ncbi:MAG: PilZ domain-containing protein [Acidobacteria bacterium]|nr:PilZ domain-containing protein [Acidobacteriota bacterium]